MDFVSLFTISVAHAQLKLPGVVSTVSSGSTLIKFICVVVFSWIFIGAILLAILLTLVAAYKYLTSAGDPAKVKAAGQTLVFVAVGLAVAILARSIPIIVGSFLVKGLKLDPCASQTTTPPTGP